MAEYSRLAGGQVISNGGSTSVVLPFLPSYIEFSNFTRTNAVSGVTRAWWSKDMGQGAAFYFSVVAGPASLMGVTTTGGFSTVQGGTSLQYGPVYQHTGSTDFSISKANPAVVTTTTAHGLTSGNVVIFQNLYQTSTTGMAQIAGMPFIVTVLSPTTFSIPWNTNQSNYTAFNTATSTNNVGSFKQVLFPALYVPGTSVITNITLGNTTIVDTTAPHNFVVGQEVGFRIPSVWGPTGLNELPNVIIPGSPIYGFVTAVNSSTEVVVNINSTGFTAFNSNQLISSVPGLKFPQIVAVGDNNSGSNQFGFNPPTVFNGNGTTAVPTINGPAIAGAYINATYQGFIIGAGISGTAGDLIFWRAQLDDLVL